MTNKNFIFCCVAGMLLNIAFGLEKANAQDTDQLSSNVNQDSVAVHSQWAQASLNIDTQTRSFSGTATTFSGSFTVGGNINTYYPVSFTDGGWNYNEATILDIGRSNVYTNGSWDGTVIASFRYHVTHWGHASNFIDAYIYQFNSQNSRRFIAGWQDATLNNNSQIIIIWLRGASTYYWYSNYQQVPTFTNGSLTVGGNTFTTKTTIDGYVNSFGPTFSNDVKVRGTIRANEIRVTAGGADFVFEPDYRLRPLAEVEQYITENKRLPEIAPAEEMIQNGTSVGELQIQLLQKIEELTLYVIELKKEIDELKNDKSQKP